MHAITLVVARTMQLTLYSLAPQLLLVWEMVATLAVGENRYVGSHWSPSLNMM